MQQMVIEQTLDSNSFVLMFFRVEGATYTYKNGGLFCGGRSCLQIIVCIGFRTGPTHMSLVTFLNWYICGASC